MKILVTGGAGFIGSHFVDEVINRTSWGIINLDKLTYAGHLGNLAHLRDNPRHTFVKGDILDRNLLRLLLQQQKPDAIIHFAAETHVDRSIDDATSFVETNVNGTLSLLQETLSYWKELSRPEKERFRFLHISTDEVYGSLDFSSPPSTETSLYAPSSPYAASKAASDHLVHSFFRTFHLPILMTHCSNNFGPRQFPEKMIPLTILNALQGKPIPIYGDGKNIRNWLFVQDHCDAILTVLEKGAIGQTYNIGSDTEISNIELVSDICHLLDELFPKSTPRGSLIQFVQDRPGHDRRYALDWSKLKRFCGWTPKHNFREALKKTVLWYSEHPNFLEEVVTDEIKQWLVAHYGH